MAERKTSPDFHQVKLAGLIIDPVSKTPVMLLKLLDSGQVIPIWIGEYEANAITMELEKIVPPRPMTHDLFTRMIDSLPCRLIRICIDCLREHTYHAKMHLSTSEGEKVIDCRPSDAVIIALKRHTDMFVHQSIIDQSSLSDYFSDYLYNRERLDQWFSAIRLDDQEGDVEH